MKQIQIFPSQAENSPLCQNVSVCHAEKFSCQGNALRGFPTQYASIDVARLANTHIKKHTLLINFSFYRPCVWMMAIPNKEKKSVSWQP
jgi:hypothetical protein